MGIIISLFENIIDRLLPSIFVLFDGVVAFTKDKKRSLFIITAFKFTAAFIFSLYVGFRLFVLKKNHTKSDTRIDFFISIITCTVLLIAMALAYYDYKYGSNCMTLPTPTKASIPQQPIITPEMENPTRTLA